MFDTQGFAALTEARELARDQPADRFDFRMQAAALRRSRTSPAARARTRTTPQRDLDQHGHDATRRDRQTHRRRSIAPNVEAFGRESVFFARAATPASFTIGAVGSAFSGRSLSQLMWMSGIPKNIFSHARELFQRQQVVVPHWGFLQRNSFRQLVLQGAPTRYRPARSRSRRAVHQGIQTRAQAPRARDCSGCTCRSARPVQAAPGVRVRRRQDRALLGRGRVRRHDPRPRIRLPARLGLLRGLADHLLFGSRRVARRKRRLLTDTA